MRSMRNTLAILHAQMALHGLNAMVRYEETGEERPLYQGNTTNRDPALDPDPETRQQRRHRERMERKGRVVRKEGV